MTGFAVVALTGILMSTMEWFHIDVGLRLILVLWYSVENEEEKPESESERQWTHLCTKTSVLRSLNLGSDNRFRSYWKKYLFITKMILYSKWCNILSGLNITVPSIIARLANSLVIYLQRNIKYIDWGLTTVLSVARLHLSGGERDKTIFTEARTPDKVF